MELKKKLKFYAIDFRVSMEHPFLPLLSQARMGWHEILNVMKSNNLQPILLYTAKLSLRIKGMIKNFPRQEKAIGVHHH